MTAGDAQTVKVGECLVNNGTASAADRVRCSLAGCDVHTTTILGTVDEDIFRSLGALVTSEPKFQRKALYRKR